MEAGEVQGKVREGVQDDNHFPFQPQFQPHHLFLGGMNRYHFKVTLNGIRFKVDVNANNPMTAYGKVKRLYPMATNIHLTRTERLWNKDMW